MLDIEVLRVIDKYDKVGLDGVRKLLTTGLQDQSGTFIPGLGLEECQVSMILQFLTSRGITNEDTISQLQSLSEYFRALDIIVSNPTVVSRLEVVNHLDDQSLLDWFIGLPTNKDDTWSLGRRPHNIGWAIDDLIKSNSNLLSLLADQLKQYIVDYMRA